MICLVNYYVLRAQAHSHQRFSKTSGRAILIRGLIQTRRRATTATQAQRHWSGLHEVVPPCDWIAKNGLRKWTPPVHCKIVSAVGVQVAALAPRSVAIWLGFTSTLFARQSSLRRHCLLCWYGIKDVEIMQSTVVDCFNACWFRVYRQTTSEEPFGHGELYKDP